LAECDRVTSQLVCILEDVIVQSLMHHAGHRIDIPGRLRDDMCVAWKCFSKVSRFVTDIRGKLVSMFPKEIL
jgi:hypothetical protein